MKTFRNRLFWLVPPMTYGRNRLGISPQAQGLSGFKQIKSPRDRAIFGLLFFHGLRASEPGRLLPTLSKPSHHVGIHVSGFWATPKPASSANRTEFAK